MLSSAAPHVLVTGATGYVGGRLVPRLLEAGWRVRVLARDPARLADRPWRAQVEVVRGDVLQPEGAGCRIVQTAIFAPRGLAGHLYWCLLYPLHGPIFGSMVRRLARLAEARNPGVPFDR